MSAGTTCLGATLAAAILGATPARADQRAVQRFDASRGLPTDDVTAVAQDAGGFLWIGTNAGLARFDGETIVPWTTSEIRGRVHLIVPARDRVFVAELHGTLWEVEGSTAREVVGPEDTDIFGPSDVGIDADGSLWLAQDGESWRRTSTGIWSRPHRGCFGGERVLRFAHEPNHPMHIATTHAIWRATSDEAVCPERLADAVGTNDMLVTSTGDVHVLERSGRWWRLRDGQRTLLHAPTIQGRALAVRGTDVWASYSEALAVVRADDSVTSWGGDGAMGRGGPLAVDHEGSLWVAAVDGLLQYVEPDTITHTLRSGEQQHRVLHLTDADDGLLVTSWWGTAMLEDEGSAPHLGRLGEELAFGIAFRERLCPDAEGTLWGSVYSAQGYVVRTAGTWMLHDAGQPVRVDACATAFDGGVWLATGDGLMRTDDRIVRASLPWTDGRFVDQLLEDASGRLWIASGPTICSAASGGADAWSCAALPERVAHLTGLVEVDDELWASTAADGLYATTDGRWRRLPGSDALASRVLYALRPSQRGGIWIAGSGVAVRAVPRPDSDDGFEVVERLGARHGLLGAGAQDILEDDEGGLWIASPSGLTRVPAHVRQRQLPAPQLVLMHARIDGKGLQRGDDVELPPSPGLLELEFSAPSFVDRGRLRYRTQLAPDQQWSAPFDHPTLQLFDLPAGRYEIRVAATDDGEHWSTSPDVVRLEVAAPLHQRPWVWALLALGAGLLGHGLNRLRLTVHTRLAQQRLGIAMDLHDDLASGLGSIGLVADLLGRSDLPARDQAELARDITSTAKELGDSVRSLVWSLREDRDSLESLGLQLADRAGMVVPGLRPRLRTDFPRAWPRIELSLAVRRNVLLMAQEALHNAVRHARADTVTIGLRMMDAHHCMLWVEDDGCGVPTTIAAREGMGLKNLRRRADAMGATLSVATPAGRRGTRVEVVFSPKAADRRVLRGMGRRLAR